MSRAPPILTVAEMVAAEAAAIAAGVEVEALMERAGAAAAAAIAERRPPGRAVILAGPGNNGGDGYVVARQLAERGWTVRIAAPEPPRTPAAKAMAARWSGAMEERLPIATDELVVDALFGAGFRGALPPAAIRLARDLERSPERVVAVDTPSGVAGDTGRSAPGGAFRAGLTVTFHARKIAHVLEPGRSSCGEVVVADIGLPPSESATWENDPELWGANFPWPGIEAHKHSRGRLVVVSGEAWNTGAARLAARAGLRVGAGLVTLATPPDALAVNAAHLEAIMLAPFDSEQDIEALGAAAEAAVIGPAAGVSESTAANVLALARTGAALLVDADGLTVFRDDPDELFQALDRDDVLTPHPGEFERVFPGVLASAPERLTAARRAAERAEAVVLLKGPDTVIAAPDGRAAVNLNGVPWLATAGSGDVLAGLIGGLLAQGMPSFEAACAGAWIHAEAGRRFGAGLISEDLPGLAPKVLNRLKARFAGP